MSDTFDTRTERIHELFASAMPVGPEARVAQLDEACAGDPELRKAVEDLLENYDLAQPFFARFPPNFAREALRLGPEPGACAPGDQFVTGDVVAERFRIVREVARGGMAIVYEAVDEKLNQRIAIKRPTPGFSQRLPPEALSALQVTHDNVCRTYGIHAAQTSQGDVDFLTMEFLEGETLAEILDREGALDAHTARDVALQLCAGLEEAHRKNVIHRDLKSRNVILTKAPGGQLRAAITDFGLARQVSATATTGPLPAGEASGLCGTPAYMAPELWRGEPASVASDIYALGVILCEIVTGQRPFRDDGPPITPRVPRRLSIRAAPGAPASWEPVILRCLDPVASRRFRSIHELKRALQRRDSGRWVWVASVLAATIAANGAFSYDPGWRSNVPVVRLVVGEFEIDPALQAVGTGVVQDASERLMRLNATSRFRVVPVRQAIQRHIRTPEEARTAFGATHLLSGTLWQRDGKIVATASVVDTSTQRTLRERTTEYEHAEIGNLPRSLVGTVTDALELPSAIPEPVGAAASVAYAAGVSYLRGDATKIDTAIEWFEQAIQLDADSASPHAGLAESQLQKFRDTHDGAWKAQAAESVGKALARNPDAVPVHIAAGRLEYEDGLYERAADDFRRAIALEPRNADAHRRLAKVYEKMEHQDEALASYKAAVSAEPGYYHAWMDLGVFHYNNGRYDDAVDAFLRATSLLPDVALGHSNLGGAYNNLGRYDEAEAEFRAALRLRESPEAFENLAASLAFKHQDADAIVLYRRALEFPPLNFRLWMNLGDACRRVGRSSDARHAYRQGEALAERDLREKPKDAYIRAFVAYFYGRLGDTKNALNEIEQALKLAPGDHRVLWRALCLFEALGQRDRALQELSSATSALLADVSRLPDLVALSRDPRFQELRAKKDQRPR